MLKSEDEVQQRIRLEAPKIGVTLWRNNTGVLKDETGRPVRYGLANDSKKLNEEFKSSDLIGFTPVVITQEMVGRTMAIFTAVEVKAEGLKNRKLDKRAIAQTNFITFILRKGGFAGLVHSVDEFMKVVGR